MLHPSNQGFEIAFYLVNHSKNFRFQSSGMSSKHFLLYYHFSSIFVIRERELQNYRWLCQRPNTRPNICYYQNIYRSVTLHPSQHSNHSAAASLATMAKPSNMLLFFKYHEKLTTECSQVEFEIINPLYINWHKKLLKCKRVKYRLINQNSVSCHKELQSFFVKHRVIF